MWLRRVHQLRDFRGLATAGTHAATQLEKLDRGPRTSRAPLNWQYNVWAAEVQNFRAPAFKPTTEFTGSREGLGLLGQRLYALGYLEGNTGRHLLAAVKRNDGGGGLYDTGFFSGSLTDLWGTYAGRPALNGDVNFDFAVLGPRAFAVSLGNPILVTDGLIHQVSKIYSPYYTNVGAFDLLVPAPGVAPFVAQYGLSVDLPQSGWNHGHGNDPNASNPTAPLAAGTYQYCYTYVRSWDAAESPPSPIATLVASGTGTIMVWPDYTVWGNVKEPRYGIDQIRVYRTAAGGGTFRFLCALPLGLKNWYDTIPDTALGEALTTQFILTDCSANSACVANGKLYLYNTIEEGVACPGRLRFADAGQSYFLDPSSYTDEIPGVGHAVRPFRDGLIAFSSDGTWIVTDRGAGILSVQETGWPGALSPQAVTRVRGGWLWISERGAHFVDDYMRYREIGSPELDGIFAVALRSPLSSPVALGSQTRHEAIVCVPPATGYDPSKRGFQTDLTVGDWWGMDPPPGARAGVTFVDHANRERVIVGSDGALYEMYAGQPTKSSITIGPLMLETLETKRFRRVEVDVTARDIQNVTVKVDARMADSTTRTYVKERSVKPHGTPLGKYVLGKSLLARPEIKTVTLGVWMRAVEITVTVTIQGTAGINSLPARIEMIRIEDQTAGDK